jgi:hypothetical protein
MGVKRRGQSWYADTQADLRTVLADYSSHEYPIDHFTDAVCKCGHRLFTLRVDDTAGAAVRVCTACKKEHAIGDSREYLDEAELEDCFCRCGKNAFEITAGVALYENSADVRWFYVGCRCPACGLAGCYGDWKNEYSGYQKLMRRV